MWGAWQCWAQLCLTIPTCHPQTMHKGRMRRLTHPLGIGQARGGYPRPLWSPSQDGGDKMAIVFLHIPITKGRIEQDMHISCFMTETDQEKEARGKVL